MFRLKLTRLLGALAVGSMCASSLVASCTTPDFKFVDDPVAPSHCTNSERDEGESDVDCGGTCAPCALTQRCATSADCRDGECTEGTCQAAGCSDATLGGSETDIDCGGGSCKPCAVDQTCKQASDCAAGVCSGSSCAAPTCSDRVPNGDETDVDCGGTACSPCIAGQSCLTPSDCVAGECTSGKCTLSCAAGTGNCDGNAANGCETNLRTDSGHCGDCETECALGNAAATCQAGACRVSSCSAPFDDCNGDPEDGCEVNTKTDVANCGACAAKPCPTLNGKAYCAESACGITCNDNFADCDGESGNGCEKDVSRDVNNCGACNKKCTGAAGKTPWCRNGQCGETSCAAGRGDCNGDPDDDPAHGGCETDFKADLGNCGSCGNSCAIAGGEAQCSNGTCAIKKCDTGLADCAGGYANGCETNTNTDIANCGTCGKACSAAGGTPQCSSATCSIKSCSGTQEDCNGLPGDGCEINVKTDKNNCGECGVVCGSAHTTATSCTNSLCTPTCAAGWKNCGSPQAGCNTQLGTSANCTACGQVCSGATPYCTASGCSGHLDIAAAGSPTSAAAVFDGSNVPIFNKNHLLTNGPGNSRLVLVGLTAAEPYLITESVKYNGVTMTPAVQAKTNEGHSYAGIFYLLDAQLPGSPATYQVQVTFDTNMYAGLGTVDVVEFKNVAQTGTFVTTAQNASDTDCNTALDRGITLAQTQPGTWGYAVTGARTGSSVTPSPNFVSTMNLAPSSPWPLAGVAGYTGPFNGNFAFSWTIMNCWNSASVAVALKRVGD